jgi:general secretion pathway protein F
MMERIAALPRGGDWHAGSRRFTKLFEPLLMAFIGMVIGLIVVLMYLPIFDLAGSIQ